MENTKTEDFINVEASKIDSSENAMQNDDLNSIETDPYFYTKRDEFTSEVFKVEVQNLPKHFGFGQIKKMLTQLNLRPHKIKVTRKATYGFVTFKSEDDRQNALKTLNGYHWRGKILKAKKANPMADPLIQKRKLMEDSIPEKRSKIESSLDEDIPLIHRLKNAVIPLWELAYEEQLKMKEKEISEFLQKLGQQIKKANPKAGLWCLSQKKKYNGMCCPLEPVKPSPIIVGYRNKCEFSVGFNPETCEKTVGFRLGTYKTGSRAVMEPFDCNNISESMKGIVKACEEYIRHSDKEPFDHETHNGYWKQVTVRTSSSGDILLILTMHPQNLTEEELLLEKNKIQHYFCEDKGKACGVTSLYFQPFSYRLSGDFSTSEGPYELISGSPTIQEELLGMKFRISPDAFFQVNVAGAEILYKTIADWSDLSPNVTILDICCGTGTIGLTLAKHVRKVIGIEMCEKAVEDARFNARLNGITNADFLCGKAEELMSTIVPSLKEKIVAIVDPPRPGLHSKVVLAIRRCSYIQRLIYVSCSPSHALNNFVDLCRPLSKRFKGVPFFPTIAVPIDLFPHTNHCELVVLFERIVEKKENAQCETGIQNVKLETDIQETKEVKSEIIKEL